MQARVIQTLRMFCRTPSILAKSSPTFLRSFLRRHGPQRQAFITTRAKKLYNPNMEMTSEQSGEEKCSEISHKTTGSITLYSAFTSQTRRGRESFITKAE